ncbi:hypothetical protein EMGBS15_13990 [Filimonas sp.]|nr:hypothetical protein EMGBS15_13990 [Filimonas sp.]
MMKLMTCSKQPQGYYLRNKRAISMTILFLFVILKAKSQSADSIQPIISMPFVFAEFGLGDANGMSTSVGGNLLFINYWGLNVTYQQVERKSRNVPDDYEHGLCILSCVTPGDRLYMYACRLSKGFETRTQLIRFRVEAGVAWGAVSKSNFYTPCGLRMV